MTTTPRHLGRLVGFHTDRPVYAIDPGTGGGSGGGGICCDLAKLQTTDCLIAVGPSNSVMLRYNGAGHWVSTNALTYPSGSGTLDFWYSGGMLHLSLGTSGSYSAMRELQLDCRGCCWNGGPLTGHVPSSGYSACSGQTFQVCLACSPCPTHVTECCPGVNLPDTCAYTLLDSGVAAECAGSFYTGRSDPWIETGPGVGYYPISIHLPGDFYFEAAIRCGVFCGGWSAGGAFSCQGVPGDPGVGAIYTFNTCPPDSLGTIVSSSCSPLYVEVDVGYLRIVITEI